MDLGFEAAGYEVIDAVDHDIEAVNCYNNNLRSTARHLDLRLTFPVPKKRPDVLLAGPPCQGFSTAGGYQNRNDPRNDLLLLTCQMTGKIRPRVLVLENVAALTNQKNASYLEQARQILQGYGYSVELLLLSANEFGVAQRRKRLFIIARSNQRAFQIPAPKGTKLKTVREALAEIPEGSNAHAPSETQISSRCMKIVVRIGPGQKLSNVRASESCIPTWSIPEVFGKTSRSERQILEVVQRLRRTNRRRDFGDADSVLPSQIATTLRRDVSGEIASLLNKKFLKREDVYVDLVNTFNGKYRRLDPDDVSPTVDTRFGDVQLFVHPTEHRALTAREAARIQGFPDKFQFTGSKRTSLRLIGNAVPPPLGKAVAKMVRDLI